MHLPQMEIWMEQKECIYESHSLCNNHHMHAVCMYIFVCVCERDQEKGRVFICSVIPPNITTFKMQILYQIILKGWMCPSLVWSSAHWRNELWQLWLPPSGTQVRPMAQRGTAPSTRFHTLHSPIEANGHMITAPVWNMPSDKYCIKYQRIKQSKDIDSHSLL